MAEDLTECFTHLGVRCRYQHADIETLERSAHPRPAPGELDALIGINLLRAGLDIPEVWLVAALDADKEGLLRSQASLIQTIGRKPEGPLQDVQLGLPAQSAGMKGVLGSGALAGAAASGGLRGARRPPQRRRRW